MPTFDFQCDTCGHIFEFTRPFGSNTVPTCESCEEGKVTKLIAPPAIHFKGDGFYKTDTQPKKKEEVENSDAKNKKESKGNETKKSEPKKEASVDTSSSKDSKKN